MVLGLQSNALKFTKSGEVRIRISTKDLNDGGKHLIIEVIDTGIGISPDNKKKLFQAFGILEDKE